MKRYLFHLYFFSRFRKVTLLNTCFIKNYHIIHFCVCFFFNLFYIILHGTSSETDEKRIQNKLMLHIIRLVYVYVNEFGTNL